jgi:kumamolisin
VPDVAAVADPQTGYRVLVDGQQMIIGGTSAVAPLWAGLVARITQLSGTRIGLAQIPLYAGVAARGPAPHLRDITDGTNGAYRAGPGWDPCTGLGVPESSTLQAFSNGTAAAAPARNI